jgi:hypothetical protein
MVVEEDEGEDDSITGITGVAIRGNDTDRSAGRTQSDSPTASDSDAHLESANLSSKIDRDVSRTVEPDSKKPVFLTEEDEMREKDREKEAERLKNGGSQVKCKHISHWLCLSCVCGPIYTSSLPH